MKDNVPKEKGWEINLSLILFVYYFIRLAAKALL